MCGIGVLVAPRTSSVDVATIIEPYLDIVRHRGPDDGGFALVPWGERRVHRYAASDTPEPVMQHHRLDRLSAAAARPACVALGHRRLAIVDVSPTGHQPMVSEDGRYAIVYNGEVYNFEALRDELVRCGHRFHSQSDTEVVLHSFIEWGPDALRRFNGMFALAIYDAERRRLFAARDRFAVKPLYMWMSPEGVFALSSEIKQFTAIPGFRACLNPQRAYDFLNWGLTDHTCETLFAGVRQLRGGEFIDFSVDELEAIPSPVRWYDLEATRLAVDFDEAAERVGELFRDSVALRMRADVPVGTALSGGIDSSSIVCTVSARLKQLGASERQRSYSACSHIARFDERVHIEKVVAATSVDAHFVYPSVDDLFESLDAMTWHQDEPFSGTSIFAEWSVFRLVASTPVKVTLDGHGADELFGGYPTFFGPRLLELMKRGRFGEFAREALALHERHGYGVAALAGAILNFALTDSLLQRLRRASGRIPQDGAWFRHDKLAVDPAPPTAKYHCQSQTVEGYSRAQLLATSLPMQLHWADRDSMAHSIESRTPFLDYRLIEFVLSCPPEFKIRNGVTKAILRAAMKDVLPPAIATRPDKMGFVTAEEHWARVEATARFREEIDAAFEVASSVVNERARERALAIIEGREMFNLFFWRLISFGRWMKRFDVR